MGKVCHRAHTGKSNRHPCRSETLARCRQRQLVSAYCLYDECRRRSKQRMVGSRIGERLQPTAIKFKQDKLRKWNLEKSLKMYTFANKRYPQDDNIRMIFHFLDTDIQPPLRFNNPFYYEPHPLCVLAAKELQQHLSSLKLNEGKMFGVLVVQTQKDRKSTRLNSSHQIISYAVFCLKKKKAEKEARRRPKKRGFSQVKAGRREGA